MTKENLRREAGVSEAPMFRAKSVLADWDTHTTAHRTRTPGEARCEAAIVELESDLAKAKQENADLNRRLAVAATVIAALHHDNQLLRSEHHAAGTLVELRPSPLG